MVFLFWFGFLIFFFPKHITYNYKTTIQIIYKAKQQDRNCGNVKWPANYNTGLNYVPRYYLFFPKWAGYLYYLFSPKDQFMLANILHILNVARFKSSKLIVLTSSISLFYLMVCTLFYTSTISFDHTMSKKLHAPLFQKRWEVMG